MLTGVVKHVRASGDAFFVRNTSVRLTFDPELRAGTACRPHRGTAAAATDECLGGSEVRPA